jgi:hypothetical protein
MTVGLCATCRHRQHVRTPRGPLYYRCRLAAVDNRFARYPALPVLSCPGFEADDDPEER